MQHPRPIGPSVNVDAPFSPEMVAGMRPVEKSRSPIQKWGHIACQTTHVAAPLSAEMSEGWQPERHRYTAPFHAGWVAQTTLVVPFSVEMAVGSRPDRPRIFLGPRIPLPVSQTTHTDAPFSVEMIQGLRPAERSRAYEAKKVGWTVVPIVVPIFSVTAPPWQLNTYGYSTTLSLNTLGYSTTQSLNTLGVQSTQQLNTNGVISTQSLNSLGVQTTTQLNTNGVKDTIALNTDGVSSGS